MVVTKSHVPNPGFPPLSTSFLEQVANPLVLSALQQLTQPLAADAFAVACSGGVDSAMLALHAVVWARKQGKTLHFFHVHHGLQQRAEGWVDHVHELALFFG